MNKFQFVKMKEEKTMDNKIILDKCKGNSVKALLCCCRNKDRKI